MKLLRAVGLLLLTLGVGMLSAIPAQAHLLNMSNVTVALRQDGRIEMKLLLDLLVAAGSRERYYELSTINAPLQDADIQALLANMTSQIALEADGVRQQFTVTSVQFAQQPREDYLSALAWPRADIALLVQPSAALTAAAQLRIRFLGGFRFEEPIATTFVVNDTNRSMTRWLVTGQQSPQFVTTGWQGADPQNVAVEQTSLLSTFADYVGLGYLHIIPLGYDHLLFVLGLCIGCSTFRRLLVLITLFTLSHTLSLGAVSLGLVPSSPRIVEPLILLTILWVAIENLRPQRRFAVSVAMVLVFGLIHGMGFAGALKTIGLPTDAFFSALFGFNVGVELAQVSFIAVVLLLLGLLQRQRWYARLVVRNGSLAIAGVSVLLAVQLLR